MSFGLGIIPVLAQNSKEVKSAADENLNKKDKQNRKQGMWFYNVPGQFGDPAYMEFGAYKDDQKTGLWYKLSKEQQLIAIENYKQNVLNGQAQYFENGKLYCIGNYRGIYSKYAYDTFLVTNPITLIDTLVATPSEQGYTKHGNWRYYNPVTGHLVREAEYQVDILLKEINYAQPIGLPATERPKLPHEGGAHKGWNTGHSSSKKSLIK
ncbi:hypothetical protein DBR32_05555 [Taibaiella sp. KBW10]|nr:hypothetical protein DBR32_05555 [Taibaiella sp. KBW10]